MLLWFLGHVSGPPVFSGTIGVNEPALQWAAKVTRTALKSFPKDLIYMAICKGRRNR